jgi:hypothetical protein
MQSGSIRSPPALGAASSPRPRWLCSRFRPASPVTSCSPFHDVPSGASKSSSSQADRAPHGRASMGEGPSMYPPKRPSLRPSQPCPQPRRRSPHSPPPMLPWPDMCTSLPHSHANAPRPSAVGRRLLQPSSQPCPTDPCRQQVLQRRNQMRRPRPSLRPQQRAVAADTRSAMPEASSAVTVTVSAARAQASPTQPTARTQQAPKPTTMTYSIWYAESPEQTLKTRASHLPKEWWKTDLWPSSARPIFTGQGPNRLAQTTAVPDRTGARELSGPSPQPPHRWCGRPLPLSILSKHNDPLQRNSQHRLALIGETGAGCLHKR